MPFNNLIFNCLFKTNYYNTHLDAPFGITNDAVSIYEMKRLKSDFESLEKFLRYIKSVSIEKKKLMKSSYYMKIIRTSEIREMCNIQY